MFEPPILLTFAASQVLGLLAVVFVMMASIDDYQSADKGLPQKIRNFHFHPMLMSVGLLYIFGCSAVMFRVLRMIDRRQANFVHVGMHCVSLVLCLTGFTFAVQLTNLLEGEHFQTVHGLFGIVTIVLFTTQWLVSIPVFLWPKAPNNISASGIQIHILLGVGVFLCAAICTFTGLSKHSGSSTKTTDYYKTAAVFYLLYTLSIVFIVTRNKYKRPPDF